MFSAKLIAITGTKSCNLNIEQTGCLSPAAQQNKLTTKPIILTKHFLFYNKSVNVKINKFHTVHILTHDHSFFFFFNNYNFKHSPFFECVECDQCSQRLEENKEKMRRCGGGCRTWKGSRMGNTWVRWFVFFPPRSAHIYTTVHFYRAHQLCSYRSIHAMSSSLQWRALCFMMCLCVCLHPVVHSCLFHFRCSSGVISNELWCSVLILNSHAQLRHLRAYWC